VPQPCPIAGKLSWGSDEVLLGAHAIARIATATRGISSRKGRLRPDAGKQRSRCLGKGAASSRRNLRNHAAARARAKASNYKRPQSGQTEFTHLTIMTGSRLPTRAPVAAPTQDLRGTKHRVSISTRRDHSHGAPSFAIMRCLTDAPVVRNYDSMTCPQATHKCASGSSLYANMNRAVPAAERSKSLTSACHGAGVVPRSPVGNKACLMP